MNPRHFPYQHPTFGTEKKPKLKSAWENSVYYWWWEYLKRHEGYKRTCSQEGKGRYAKLYADFGDVHASDFKTWWREYGVILFSEPQKEHLLSVIEGEIPAENLGNPSLLFVQIPLNLPVRTIKQKFEKLLKKHHKGAKGIRYARASHAKYPVIGQPNINALKTTLMVYDYRAANPDLTLWEIALILDQFKGFVPAKNSQMKLADHTAKNLMSATVSRYLKKAETMIENVGLGRFPDVKKAPSPTK